MEQHETGKEQEGTSGSKDEIFVDVHGVRRYKATGQIAPGNTANPYGREPDTEEDKIKKKAIREYIEEYKQKLAEALPRISPVLIRKAEEGDVAAIRELHDRVMGKAPQQTDITTGGDKIFQWGQEK